MQRVLLLSVLAMTAAACAHKPASIATAPVGGQSDIAAAQRGIVAGSAEDFRAAVSDRVFFDTDQHYLRADAREVLARQAAWLRLYPEVRVQVGGYCDERGTREYNIGLGARRANAARDFLVSSGVALDRIETTSYGKDRPIDTRPNEEGWAVNRNAHTELVNPRVS